MDPDGKRTSTRAVLLAASGQLHGRHWAGSHGRRHRTHSMVSQGSLLPTSLHTATCTRRHQSHTASSVSVGPVG